MNTKALQYIAALVLMVGFGSCDETKEDLVPTSFKALILNPDEIYTINGGEYGVRLDVLVNDSVKVDVTISYSAPSSGTIRFITNEGWFYKPTQGFVGTDNFTYTACYKQECATAAVTMHVEAPYDPATCVFQINGESVETLRDQPVQIRIFDNDIVCPYQGSSVSSPEKGLFNYYTYSGSFKNTVYIYYPPKGFVGTDRFKYRLFTPDGYLETYCTITIK